MRRIALVMCSLVTATASILIAQEKIPTIVFKSLTKDFGKVIAGQSLKHKFEFTNRGDVPLEILKVEPS